MSITDIVGVGDLVKCVTKSGRTALAKKVLDKFVNRKLIIETVVGKAVELSNKGISALPENRVKQLTTGFAAGEEAFGTLRKVLDPEGDGGSNITIAEAATLVDKVETAVSTIVTDEALEKAKEKALEFVK